MSYQTIASLSVIRFVNRNSLYNMIQIYYLYVSNVFNVSSDRRIFFLKV